VDRGRPRRSTASRARTAPALARASADDVSCRRDSRL